MSNMQYIEDVYWCSATDYLGNFHFSIKVSSPDINNLANTTITKVPAVRAVTAKTIGELPHGLAAGLKHEDYPAGYGGSSALLDTYLQYIGENMLGMY